MRCGCLKENAEWLNAGDCDCGAHSGTQGSAHGDHGCAPLQRVNTYTTCAGGSNLGQHSKNPSCRVLLPTSHNNHHGANIHFTGQLGAHNHHHHHQTSCKSSCSARSQHQAEAGGQQQRARCCSSYSNSANMQRRFSPSSSAAVCGASVNYSRSASRAPKFVFRTNFPTQSSCHQQQRLLSGAGAGSPTSITIPSGVNTTAESHIWKWARKATITAIWCDGNSSSTTAGQMIRTKEICRASHLLLRGSNTLYRPTSVFLWSFLFVKFCWRLLFSILIFNSSKRRIANGCLWLLTCSYPGLAFFF